MMINQIPTNSKRLHFNSFQMNSVTVLTDQSPILYFHTYSFRKLTLQKNTNPNTPVLDTPLPQVIRHVIVNNLQDSALLNQLFHLRLFRSPVHQITSSSRGNSHRELNTAYSKLKQITTYNIILLLYQIMQNTKQLWTTQGALILITESQTVQIIVYHLICLTENQNVSMFQLFVQCH